MSYGCSHLNNIDGTWNSHTCEDPVFIYRFNSGFLVEHKAKIDELYVHCKGALTKLTQY